MAAKPLLLRCKTKTGQHVLENLTGENTVQDLQAILMSLTGISPEKLRVLAGFPPREIDLSNSTDKLDNVLSQQRETLIVEEAKEPLDNRNKRRSPVPPAPNRRDAGLRDVLQPRGSNEVIPGILLRRVVPANNSCLFTSVYFALSGGEFNNNIAPAMRQIIAQTVADDPQTYNEAFLGKPNREYCTWILNEEHWGGAIELSILSKHYKVEIVAVDTQNVRLNRFGEDMNYPQRILLIYDGIHYDPLMLEPLENGQTIQTMFPTSDDSILAMGLEMAREAKASRQFVDVNNFTLKCLVCNTGLTGQVEAQKHAKSTGHINFGEV